MAEVRDITESYRLGRVLKSSPGGIVFRATDPGTGRQVAIKLINSGGLPDHEACRQRFTAAVRTLQSLGPACFPTVLDFGFTPDGSAFMVLELVEGSAVTALAGSSPARVLARFGPVIDGLDVLAARGIVHHNLAPENLLLTPGRDGEEIKVLGFGTAAYRWPAEAGRLEPGLSPGFRAPEFDAPEEGGEPDWRADIYSLSLVICQLLEAKATPPDCPTITLPAAIRAGLCDADELCALLRSGLRRFPDQRPPSYQALRRAVSIALTGKAAAKRGPEKTELIRLPTNLGEASGAVGEIARPPVEPTIAIRIRGKAAKGTPPVVLAARPLEPTMAFHIQPEVPAVAVSREALSVPAAVPPVGPPANFAASNDAMGDDFGRTIAIQTAGIPEPREPREIAAPPGEPEVRPTLWPVPEPLDGRRVVARAPLVEPEAAPPEHGITVAGPPSPVQDEHKGRPSPLPEMPPPAPLAGTAPPPGPRSSTMPPVGSGPDRAAVPTPPEASEATAKEAGSGEAGRLVRESAAGASQAIPSPPRSDRRSGIPRLLLVITTLALMLVAGGIFVASRMIAFWTVNPAPTPVAQIYPATAPRVTPIVPVLLVIQQARAAFDAGDLAGARTVLSSMTREDEDRLSREDYARLRALREEIAVQRAGSLAKDFDRGVRTGNVDLLRQTLAATTDDDLARISGVRRTAIQVDVARRALALEAILVAASRGHNGVEIIRAASALLGVLPACAEAVDLRGGAAAVLEEEVDELVGAGRFDAAVARLEELRSVWPARPGLDRRIEQCRSEAEAERTMSALLAEVAQAERERQPERGLELLRGAEVSGPREARLADARGRLERLLADVDREAPVIRLRPGWKPEFEKGKPAAIPLEVTDDHAVQTVTAWARVEGGTTYAELTIRHLSGTQYMVDAPVAFHRNETIEFFVTAMDASGHLGRLGTAAAPLTVKRKRWLF